MIYKFIDDKGTFTVKNPQRYNLYFPLTDKDGGLLSSISPNLSGDIKKDNDHFLTPPVSFVDLKNNLLTRRDFFLRIDKKIIRLSYPCDRESLEAGFLYHKIIKKVNPLCVEILNFVPYNLPVEIMWVKIINKGKKSIEITPTSFIPLYGRAEKNLKDHRHVSSLLNRIELDKYGIILRPTMIFDEQGHRENKTLYYVLGYENNKKPPLGQFPTLEYFCGEGSLIAPQAIGSNIKPVKRKLVDFDGKETIAAFRFSHRKIKASQETNYLLIIGIAEDGKSIKSVFRKFDSLAKVKKSLKETNNYWLDYLSGLSFDFKEKNFNNWLTWVKLQPVLRKLFGCSFLPHFDYGKGGRGWRDLWQDALALLLTEPQKARDLILKSFSGVRLDGSNATIITKEGEFIADRNKINRVWMDHGVWPYLTLRSYINKKGDLGFLLRKTTYFKDHQINRAKEIDKEFSQKDYLLRTKNNKIYTGTILEHILIQSLVPFFNVGAHNIIKLENADWNDGLDMAPNKGESVTFSFMYAHNLVDLCFFLEKLKKQTRSVNLMKELSILLDRLSEPVNYNKFWEKQKQLKKYLKNIENINGKTIRVNIDDLIYDLKEKSAHLSRWLKKKEWLKTNFFNGYYDEQGKRAEGKINGRMRMLLPSQVFPIMSKIASQEQIERAWKSIKSHLKDKRLGGFRLNTDFGSLYLSLGRAFGFVYGDKENGAFFNHMVIMFAYALYKRNFIKEASEVFGSIYRMATAEEGKIYPGIPEYFNNQGSGLYLYLTGSASWYIHTLLEEVLGIKFVLGNLILEPKIAPVYFSGNAIEVSYTQGGKRINISYIKGKKNLPSGIEKLTAQGRLINSCNGKYILEKESLNKIKAKEIKIKVYLH